MTGASFNGTTIYAFGNIYSSTTQFSVHKYTTSGSSAGQYMNQLDFPGLAPAVYDIAYADYGMWVARDEADSPILCYNTSGIVTAYVTGTEVPAAAGLAVDGDGYLWVSDPLNDKIYKVDITSSTEDEFTEVGGTRMIQPEANPFNSATLLNVQGFAPGALVQVFDVRGRIVQQGDLINDSYVLDGDALVPGTYVVRISDSQGAHSLRICRTAD